MEHYSEDANNYNTDLQDLQELRMVCNTRLLSRPYFLCSYFFLLFSESTLISLLFSPKMFEVTKNCNFFLARSTCSEFGKVKST